MELLFWIPFHSRCKPSLLTSQQAVTPLGRLPASLLEDCPRAVTPHESASRHSSRKTARLVVGRLPAYNRSRQFARTLRGQIHVDGKANTANMGTMSHSQANYGSLRDSNERQGEYRHCWASLLNRTTVKGQNDRISNIEDWWWQLP